MPVRARLRIGDIDVGPGKSATGELPVSRLVTGNTISIPLRVVHGATDGPTVWVSGAVHGDEIAGVEIIRRVLADIDPTALRGTLIAVPIVNVHGFLSGDRYFPDRRDLNRSFPGSASGSLASRVARLFMDEIVERCDVGIDLHTGSDHRTNLPQIRGDLDDSATRELAIAFDAPLMLHAKLRDGSLRAAATARGATVLLYEGGEAWRFDETAIATGVRGVRNVLVSVGMLDASSNTGFDAGTGTAASGQQRIPLESRSSTWIRTRRSGIAQFHVGLGDHVEKAQPLATIHDATGHRLGIAKATNAGIVIGITHQPLVNQGDAIVHIAQLDPEPARRSSKDFT